MQCGGFMATEFTQQAEAERRKSRLIQRSLKSKALVDLILVALPLV